MVKNYGPLICFLIMSLAIIAGVLGIEAEVAKNKVKHLNVLYFECREPSHEAYKLGVAATVLLCLTHFLSNVIGGFVCIRSKEEWEKASANTLVATIFLVLTWVILGVALPLLIVGTMANSASKEYCGLSRKRFFLVGGVLCFFHGLFCVFYYVSANATHEERKKPGHKSSGGTQMAESGHHATQP